MKRFFSEVDMVHKFIKKALIGNYKFISWSHYANKPY